MNTTDRQSIDSLPSTPATINSTDETSFTRDHPQWIYPAILGTLLLATLLIVSHQNYIFFHTLAEMTSIAVAWSVFLLVWNARKLVDNDALVFLGIAYLFVGILDLVHTISYGEMSVLTNPQVSNMATQLWIAARSMESLSLLAFTLLLGRRLWIHTVFWSYATVTSLLLCGIFTWHVFPACYVDGEGLTAFNKVTEYVICFTLCCAAGVLFSRRNHFSPVVFRLFLSSVLATVAAELSFTMHVAVHDWSNLAGHYLKLVSFFLIYIALIRMGITQPFAMLFRALEQKKATLLEKNQLIREIIECANEGIIVLGTDLRFKVWNPFMERFTGVPSSDVLDRRAADVFPFLQDSGIINRI
ncbi:MAG: hypothetical protein JXM70_16375 [Pirellulales bacterium]|nr:hypothetical protein [Pirellulales bacterium]